VSNNKIAILFENTDFQVVNKPAGVLTIPGRDPDAADSVVETLTTPNQKMWVVHRLDKETSGCLIFAKNENAHRQASQWFEKHEAKKEYWAFAAGEPRVPVQKFDQPIEGARSITQMNVVGRFPGGFLASIRIPTGKRHQIRIHLSAGGYPLFGDPEYNGKKSLDLDGHVIEFNRVALHARRLELPGGLKFEAPFPEDFVSWATQLGVVLK